MTRVRGAWAAALVTLAAAAGSLALAAPAGASEVGINVAATSGDYLASPNVLAAIGGARPSWVRVFIGWNAVEPAQGDFDRAAIAGYQRFFSELPPGTHVDVDLEGTPAWAAGGSTDIRTPPASDATFAGAINYLANAFAGRVNAWEIWNEEDSTAWWTGTPAQYVGLLKAAYPAVKSADPSATVLVGGLTGNDATYLQALYASGAQGSFDAVGVHTDTACNVTSPSVYEFDRGTQTINQYFFLGFTAVHAAMVAAGDGAKPIYMTELGWSSTTAECETGAWAGRKLGGVDPQTQASYLEEAYHCLAQPQYSYVKAAMWFELSDEGDSTAPLDNYGLLTGGYAAKPAFSAFEQESLHGDQLTGACGASTTTDTTTDTTTATTTATSTSTTTDTPTIRLKRAPLRAARRHALWFEVSAIGARAGVRELTVELSRTRRVRFAPEGFPRSLRRSIVLRRSARMRPGRHRIRVLVTDRLGRTTTATFSVVLVHIRTRVHGRAHRRRHRRHVRKRRV
ncbi:MAG: hypothetical protein ACRDLP_13885 [Solirubrobacteraceae bacterium]